MSGEGFTGNIHTVTSLGRCSGSERMENGSRKQAAVFIYLVWNHVNMLCNFKLSDLKILLLVLN